MKLSSHDVSASELAQQADTSAQLVHVILQFSADDSPCRNSFRSRVWWSGFDIHMSNPKLHWQPEFAGGPLIPTFAKTPAETRCECWNQKTTSAAFKPGSFRQMTPDQPALRVRGLTKRFDRVAVDALDLTIRPGEFYALLGPNGAGKTTTLRMVAGLLRPDAGEVSIFGVDALGDPVAAKQITAWVSDEPMIYDKLTPLEYLEFVAGLWGIAPSIAEPSARELLASLGLEPNQRERCEGFSKGMRQKVALAGALVHDPRLIILDEPLTGLDAVSARHVKGLLGERVRAGCTVIMTTHILEVAERMSDRIGVIASGRLVAEGTLAQLRQQNGQNDTSLEDMFIALVDTQAAAA
jgi:ABC-2 type transport system ATP-binding protein